MEVICEKQHYRKKLIYTNNKASKTLELYTEIVEVVKQKCKEQGKLFSFFPVQTRKTSKHALQHIKAAMTQRYGSGFLHLYCFYTQKHSFYHSEVHLQSFIIQIVPDHIPPALNSKETMACSNMCACVYRGKKYFGTIHQLSTCNQRFGGVMTVHVNDHSPPASQLGHYCTRTGVDMI